MKIIKKSKFSLFLLISMILFSSCNKEEKLQTVSLKFPSMNLTSISGEQNEIHFNDGKVRLVAFWATWCKPCLMEIPTLKNIHEKLKGRPFELLGVSVDEPATKDNVLKIKNEYAINYPLLYAPNPMPEQIGTVHTLPTTYLIDSQGLIIRKWLQPQTSQTLLDEIEKHLAESPSI